MDIRPPLAVSADAYGTDEAQSSEWVRNAAGDFQLVLHDRAAGGVPAGARILGVEGLDVDQLGTIGFSIEGGGCDSGGPHFLLTYDENGDLTPGGEGTFTYRCTTGGPGERSFSAAGPAEVADNAMVTSLDVVYSRGGSTVVIDDIRVAGLTITDFNVARAA